MDKALDMSLDDIIKSKKSEGRARGRGRLPRGGGVRGSFGGEKVRDTGIRAGRKGPLGVNARPSSFTITKSLRRTRNFPWQGDLFEESLAAAGLPGIESGTKLYISNLDHGVSNNDIRELFCEIGELKRYAIHFDKNGRPSGTAEVVYAKRSDAFAAHKRYNNIQLDGRRMKIELVSPNSEVPVSARINVVGRANGKSNRRVVLTQNAGRTISSAPTNRSVGQIRGGSRNGAGPAVGQTQQGQGRGQRRRKGRSGGRRTGKKQPLEKSAEELDNELDKYHSQSQPMQTS